MNTVFNKEDDTICAADGDTTACGEPLNGSGQGDDPVAAFLDTQDTVVTCPRCMAILSIQETQK